jgi:hypothetical protein
MRGFPALVHKVMHRLSCSAIKIPAVTSTYAQHRRVLFKSSQRSSIYDKKKRSYTQSLHYGKRVAVDYFDIPKSLNINGLFGLVFG